MARAAEKVEAARVVGCSGSEALAVEGGCSGSEGGGGAGGGDGSGGGGAGGWRR